MLTKAGLLVLALFGVANAWNKSPGEEKRSSEDVGLADLKVAYETYKECSGNELAPCLKLNLAKTLNRIAKSEDISVMGGVTFVKDKDAAMSNEAVPDVDNMLPRNLQDKDGALDALIYDQIFGFFKTHTLQVKFPSIVEMSRSVDDARGRRKKIAPFLLIPLLVGGTMVPLAFGALALLAGKALIVSKLALVLAGIIGLKKLLSNSGGHGHEAHEVVVSGGHGSAGWGRSLDEGHNLAYSAHKH